MDWFKGRSTGASCKLSLQPSHVTVAQCPIGISPEPCASPFSVHVFHLPWATRRLMVFKTPWYSVTKKWNKRVCVCVCIYIYTYIHWESWGWFRTELRSGSELGSPPLIQPVAFPPHGGDYMEVIISCVKILKDLSKVDDKSADVDA